MVLHGSGAASTWAETTQRGDNVAISGPGRGYHIDPDATAFLLAGDETAIPGTCQLLEYLPNVPITVHLSVPHTEATVDLHRNVDVTWHVASDSAQSTELLRDAIRATELPPDIRIWAAGEAVAMHRIRKYLFQEIGFPRSQATVRGYWKRNTR